MNDQNQTIVDFTSNNKDEIILGSIFLFLQALPPLALRHWRSYHSTVESNDAHMIIKFRIMHLGQYSLFNSSLLLETHSSMSTAAMWLGQMIFGLAVLTYTNSVYGFASVVVYGSILYAWHLRQIRRCRKFTLEIIRERTDLSIAMIEEAERSQQTISSNEVPR